MSQSRQSEDEPASRASAPEVLDAPVVASGDETDAVSGIAADFEAGQRLGRHRHRRAQLVYAVEGVMTVETDAGLWVVPPLRALWVPPGVVHSIRMTGRVRMRTVYFDGSVLAHSKTPPHCAVLGVTPLLRELIVRVVEADRVRRETMTDDAKPVDAQRLATNGDDRDSSQRRNRWIAVLLDELVLAPIDPLELPMPRDERARRIADAVLAEPGDPRDLPAWASFGGVSERTLARLFPQETGMTFVRWRQQVRLLRALERLAIGDPVTAVAVDMGYASTSAFVKLFRESLGVTPGRYFAEREAGLADLHASARD